MLGENETKTAVAVAEHHFPVSRNQNPRVSGSSRRDAAGNYNLQHNMTSTRGEVDQ
ncbi:unnamed protein product, partial [Nesidiocoris tenuis]